MCDTDVASKLQDVISATSWRQKTMEKYLFVIVAATLLFTSCETLGNLKSELFKTDSTETSSKPSKIDTPAEKKSKGTQIEQPSYTKDKIDTVAWDLSVLDTARNVDYMNEIEKNVVLEMNMARSNPQKYAEMYIEPRTKKFNGNIYDNYLITNEGVAVVNECVKFMNSQKALPAFAPSKGLSKAAQDHSSTQSLTDKTGHDGTDGSNPFERMMRYGSFTTAGENIDYGARSAREIVISLLIDDGVKNRGHRNNIMNKSFTTVGVGYADKHKKYGSECVIDYSGPYVEKN